MISLPDFGYFVAVGAMLFTVASAFKSIPTTTNRRSSKPLIVMGDSLILDDVALFIDRKSRPAHVGIPRKRMELSFAVQLMRNSYTIADELDFVPMDEFQKDFFLYRQSEWEDYRGYHPTVMQGDLADPLYFDFISFAQYATIADKIRKGKLQFVEKIGAEGETQVVRRNPRYQDNDFLPSIHSQLVGERLLDWMYEKYPASILPPLTPSAAGNEDKLIGYMQMVLDIFAINTFCLSAEVTAVPMAAAGVVISPAPTLFGFGRSSSAAVDPRPVLLLAKIALKAPANLWSQQVLRIRKDLPINDFEIKVVQALARRFGYDISVVATDIFNQIDVVHVVAIRKA